MNRSTFLLWVMLFCPVFLFAQQSIQSKVLDAGNGESIQGANVRLMNASDSSFVQAVQTNSDGNFKLENVKNGRYILSVSFLGYYDHVENLTVRGNSLTLKNVRLKENTTALSEVEVTGTAAQMVVKGDTIEFNATAFKLGENAVVEDLLKRLPGVEISSEGKITVNGEEVTKIRVDGKKFFEGDNEMATKNIPADAIEKVQVLEEKSEMAKLTGFEDDDTERIINLTFKASRKKGQFGNVTAGAGMDVGKQFRYDGTAFLNIINGDVQTTITGGANNTNTTRSTRGRGGFNTNTGISETQTIGVNNTSIISPSLTLGGDGTFNHTNNNTQTESNRESYIGNSVYHDYTNNKSLNDYYSVNARFELEWKIDSLSTLIFQPDLNYNRSITNTNNDFLYLIDSDTASYGFTKNNGIGTQAGASLRTTFNHKFASKLGRTLTARANFGFSQNDRESVNFSEKFEVNSDTVVDQQTFQTSDKYNFSFRLSYVEPLWNIKNMIEIVASVDGSFANSEKKQYNKNNATKEYTEFDSVYSSSFRTNFFRESFELNYKYTEQQYNLTVGLKVEPAQTYSFGTRELSTNVVNFAPSARFQYNFGRRKFIRLFYRGRTSQPSIDQMQPVKNNSNLMSETIGNPTLNPSFNHSLRAMFSSFNATRFSSVSASLWASATKDALVNNSIYDETGKRYSQTVNSKVAPVNAGTNFMYNTPLFKQKIQFNTNTQFDYNKRYGYVSRGQSSSTIDPENLGLGDLSETENYSFNENIALTYANDFIEIGMRGGFRYSKVLNNMNTSNTETYDWTSVGNLTLNLPYDFKISSDIGYTTRQGYVGFDQNELLWNASIDKSLFKNKAVVSFKAFDILQQRLNIRQSIGENYIQNTKYNTLQSYAMLSFTYKLSNFSGAVKESDLQPRSRDFGPPDPGSRRPF